MRKRGCMGILLALVIVLAAGYLYFFRQFGAELKIPGGGLNLPCIAVRTEQNENDVQLWLDEEGKGYFFLPSCVTRQKLRLGDLGGTSVRIDGDFYEEGDTFIWEEDRSYQLQVTDASYQSHIWEVAFFRSDHIPAMFIATESGRLDNLHESKENEEQGRLCVVQQNGSTEYQGELLRISGRGNNTWEYEKKPYAIKLKEAAPLLGLRQSDRWQLLALWRESSKMDNKIAMDMAEALEIPYAAQGTWVDLYLNGEYRGIYLLAESLSVGEGRIEIYNLEKENKQRNPAIGQGNTAHYEEENNKGYEIENGTDISGGYLIEKVHPDHWAGDESAFLLGRGYHFAVNAPQHASREQAAYIRSCVEEIDQLVVNDDAAVWAKLDLPTFTKLFLVDEISMEMDAGCASMYFYKDRGDDKLYAGPPWDYDNAFGEYDTDDSFYLDPQGSIVYNSDRQAISLDWYKRLYETSGMQRQITEEYTAILPFFEELLENGIDSYAGQIRASVKMDHARWESLKESGSDVERYESFDANVNYMKYFLANRLNCLCERWNAPHALFQAPSSGEMHQITFSVYEGVVGTMEVMDGTPLMEPPAYDASQYQGWVYRRRGGTYSPYIPIYEDMELYNAKWE